MALADDIMAGIAADGPQAVEVPEWGQTVYLHTLSVGELIAMAGDDDTDRTWSILAAAMRDADGVPVFAMDALRDMPASQAGVVMRLMQQVQALNGMADTGEA